MTGASGGDDGGRDLRSTFESTSMDVHGIVHLTREVSCMLMLSIMLLLSAVDLYSLFVGKLTEGTNPFYGRIS